MNPQDLGFAVMYRWRIHPEREDAFIAAWRALTEAIATNRGGRGSRLHRTDDGRWVAYARWPDRATWERAQAQDSPDPAASEAMSATIAESFPPVPLEPVADLLSGD